MRLANHPMRTIVLLAATIVTVSVIDCPTVRSDEFQAQSTVGRFMEGLKPQNWKMPSLQSILPGQNERDQIKKRKDGLVQEVTESAKRSWQKTKDTLNPKRLIPTNLFGAGSQPNGQSQGGGFLSSLLGGGNSAQERAASASDFLRQDKPRR